MSISQQDAARKLLERRRARANLVDFACYVDPTAARWYHAQHLRRIADVLQSVERGEIKRAIINVPPRHWKSSVSSEKFPAWWLGRNSKSSIIVASYALSLAEKFSKSVRECIQSERYRALFPHIRIARDSNRSDDWLVDGGYRTSFRAVGTGVGISGHGAKLILLDDVSDPNVIAASSTQAEKDWTWYKSVIRTRLEPDGAIVVINNRVSVNDLTGYLLDRERNDSADPPDAWTVIDIPAQQADGTYLWQDRFGEEYYRQLQQDATLWRIQYQQRPTVDEGTEIRREWFEFVAQLPDGVSEKYRTVDTAWTKKKRSDYTASIGSAVANGWLYLIDPQLMKASIPDVVDWIKARKVKYPAVRFGLAKAAGDTISRDFLTREGIPTDELEAESVDLTQRLVTFIWWSKRGKVKLVGDASRWEQFLSQATAFPDGKHDDLLACCANLTQMHRLTTETRKPEPPLPDAFEFIYKR